VSNSDKPGFLDVMGSVISAAFGVQTSKNRARDFEGGRVLPFVVGGLIFTVLFILAIVAVVRIVVSGSI